MEHHAGCEIGRRTRVNRNVADRAGEDRYLRQGMHRLLEQQINRRGKHPVAELPRRQLTQWNIVDAADEIRFAQAARSDQIAQPHESRMVQEVLIHPDRRSGLRSSLEQRSALSAACRKRFLK